MSYHFTFEIDGLPDMVNAKRRYGHWTKLHNGRSLMEAARLTTRCSRTGLKSRWNAPQLTLTRH